MDIQEQKQSKPLADMAPFWLDEDSLYCSQMKHLIQAALDAGRAINKIYTDPEADFEIECKADNSPLTKADRASHEIITRYLKDFGYPILSEEGNLPAYDERKDWDTFWVVDPLDGTKEFIKRNGEFTVNIALVDEGVPVVGLIYVPVKRVLYVATEGDGAYKIEDIDYSIFESSEPESELSSNALQNKLDDDAYQMPLLENLGHGGKCVIVASRSHSNAETEDYIDAMRACCSEVETVSIGSSLKICLVAEGAADFYPRFAPTMEWDTAAGHAIARAAGCEIYQADGREPRELNINEPLQYNKEDLHNPWFIVETRRIEE